MVKPLADLATITRFTYVSKNNKTRLPGYVQVPELHKYYMQDFVYIECNSLNSRLSSDYCPILC